MFCFCVFVWGYIINTQNIAWKFFHSPFQTVSYNQSVIPTSQPVIQAKYMWYSLSTTENEKTKNKTKKFIFVVAYIYYINVSLHISRHIIIHIHKYCQKQARQGLLYKKFFCFLLFAFSSCCCCCWMMPIKKVSLTVCVLFSICYIHAVSKCKFSFRFFVFFNW